MVDSMALLLIIHPNLMNNRVMIQGSSRLICDFIMDF